MLQLGLNFVHSSLLKGKRQMDSFLQILKVIVYRIDKRADLNPPASNISTFASAKNGSRVKCLNFAVLSPGNLVMGSQ